MTISPNSSTQKNKSLLRKSRAPIPHTPEIELINTFWAAPLEALFGQETIAPVIRRSVKSLESDRWRGKGIPYRKCSGRVLYRKSDVIFWIENHALVTSTSEYNTGINHD